MANNYIIIYGVPYVNCVSESDRDCNVAGSRRVRWHGVAQARMDQYIQRQYVPRVYGRIVISVEWTSGSVLVFTRQHTLAGTGKCPYIRYLLYNNINQLDWCVHWLWHLLQEICIGSMLNWHRTPLSRNSVTCKLATTNSRQRLFGNTVRVWLKRCV